MEAMSDKRTETEPAVRNYLLLCLTAQAVMVLVLLRHGLRGPSLLIPFIGLAGLTVRWRMAPLFTLITLAGLLFWEGRQRGISINRGAELTFNLADWILCGATLGYLVAHYRYLALTTSVLPTDRRRLAAAGPASDLEDQRRSPSLVSSSEVGWLVLSLPIWAFLAQLCWKVIPAKPDGVGLRPHEWRGFVLLWAVVVAGFLLTTFLAYVRLQRITRTEAGLIVQDTLWLETYREQRKLNRWLARARLRRDRRKEKS